MATPDERATDDRALARLFALEQHGIKLGLDNIRTLTDALGRPQDAWAAVHIAGTNGKGSVTAMVERALRDAGHRTGRYTSPHLAHIEERVAIDGEPVDAATFRDTAERVLNLVETLRRDGALAAMPTFFEVTTAMAFEIFRRAGVRVAVIEVGLGGRFDATNIIVPIVTAITSIALDHERYLGGTRASIAFEKAGIFKAGVPAVVGELPADARLVVDEQARVRGARLVPAGLEHATEVAESRGRVMCSLSTPVRRYEHVHLGLSGPHQVANAVVAVRVLELCDEAGWSVAASNIVRGLTDVDWPARLEWLELASGSHVLLDAAHNPAGAEALARYLEASGVAPLPIVLAIMKDEDVDGMVTPLLPWASRFVATAVDSERSLTAIELADRIRRIAGDDRIVEVVEIAAPAEALQEALTGARRAVVAGSIFLVGPLRAQLLAGGAAPAGVP